MKFTIDIVRPNGRLLHYAVVEETDPTRAKTKVEIHLGTWRERGASTARLSAKRAKKSTF
jgi:hypothetical protein